MRFHVVNYLSLQKSKKYLNVISSSVFHIEETVSIGLKNVLRVTSTFIWEIHEVEKEA